MLVNEKVESALHSDLMTVVTWRSTVWWRNHFAFGMVEYPTNASWWKPCFCDSVLGVVWGHGKCHVRSVAQFSGQQQRLSPRKKNHTGTKRELQTTSPKTEDQHFAT